MTSSRSAAQPSYGSQAPRFALYPEAPASLGQEFIEIAELAGLYPDPWQRFVVERSLGIRHDGRLASPRVGLCVPRQNGKGGVLEIIELGRLFVLGSPLTLHSAHLFRTSKEAYLRLRSLITQTPELHSLVRRYSNTNGDESITLKSGARLHFVARTGGGGRGLSAECLILDEAMYLPESVMAALVPTISAKQYGQIWYTGSAVDQVSMPDGVTLARLRHQAMNGESDRLAYFEWSLDHATPEDVPEEIARDRSAWAEVNPALGIRIEPETVENERETLSPRAFAVERLNVGDWPSLDGAEYVISPEKWAELTDENSQVLDPVCFAFDVPPERSFGSICVAGKRPDGLFHVELVDRRRGTAWMPDRIKELTKNHRNCGVLFDANGPAKSLVPALADLYLEPLPIAGGDQSAACGFLFDQVEQAGLRHRGQAELASAIRGAIKRPLGDAWAWSRKNSSVDIAPLVGCTLALWGASTLSKETQPMFAWA